MVLTGLQMRQDTSPSGSILNKIWVVRHQFFLPVSPHYLLHSTFFFFSFILVLLPSACSGVKSSSLPDLGESDKFTSSPTNNGTKKGNKAVIPLFIVLYSFSSRGIEDQMSKYERQEKTLAQINATELFCSSHPGDRGTVKMIFSTKWKISKDISSPYRYFLQWKGIMNDIKLKDLTLYNWYVLVFLIIKD